MVLPHLYLEQAFREKDLYGFFQDGQQTSVMDSYPPLQKRQHVLHLGIEKHIRVYSFSVSVQTSVAICVQYPGAKRVKKSIILVVEVGLAIAWAITSVKFVNQLLPQPIWFS